MVMQEALVFILPAAVAIYRIGYVVYKLEEKVGSIIGMKYLTVSPNLFRRYVVGRDTISQEEIDLLSYPIVVMVLKGDDAMSKAVVLAPDVNKSFKRNMMHVNTCAEDTRASMSLWFPDKPQREIFPMKHQDLVLLSPTGKVVGEEKDLPMSYTEERGIKTALQCHITKDVNFLLIKPHAFKEGKVGTILAVLDRLFLHIHGLKLVNLEEYPANIAWPRRDSSSNESEGAGSHLGIAVMLRMKEIHTKILTDPNFLTDENWTWHLYSRAAALKGCLGKLFYISDNWLTAWQLCDIYFPLGFVLWKGMKGKPILEGSLSLKTSVFNRRW